MTINEVIDTLDSLQPNACTRTEKLIWLSRLNGLLRDTVWCQCQAAPAPQPINPDTDPETVLPVEAPWDELYLRYLQAQIDLTCGELTRYANSAALFNRLLTDYRNHYTRTHLPATAGWKYF